MRTFGLLGVAVLLAGAGGCTKENEGAGRSPGSVTGDGMSSTRNQSSDPQAAPGNGPRFGQTGTNLTTGIIQGTGDFNSNAAAGPDADLSQRVKVALTTGSSGTQGRLPANLLTDIQVSATNGVVTLQGPAKDAKDKESIEKFVGGLHGVKAVRNELQITPGAKEASHPETFPRQSTGGTAK